MSTSQLSSAVSSASGLGEAFLAIPAERAKTFLSSVSQEGEDETREINSSSDVTFSEIFAACPPLDSLSPIPEVLSCTESENPQETDQFSAVSSAVIDFSHAAYESLASIPSQLMTPFSPSQSTLENTSHIFEKSPTLKSTKESVSSPPHDAALLQKNLSPSFPVLILKDRSPTSPPDMHIVRSLLSRADASSVFSEELLLQRVLLSNPWGSSLEEENEESQFDVLPTILAAHADSLTSDKVSGILPIFAASSQEFNSSLLSSLFLRVGTDSLLPSVSLRAEESPVFLSELRGTVADVRSLLNQVSGRLEVLSKLHPEQEIPPLKIHLEPKDLGVLEIHVTFQDSQVFLKFIGESPAIHLLQQHAQMLSQTLEQQGLSLHANHMEFGFSHPDTSGSNSEDLAWMTEGETHLKGSSKPAAPTRQTSLLTSPVSGHVDILLTTGLPPTLTEGDLNLCL